MRIQSSFEKIAQTTNGRVFGFFFVVLRVAAGLSVLYYGLHHVVVEPSQMSLYGLLVAFLVYGLGLSYTFGFLVRPFALLALIETAVTIFVLFGIGGQGSAEFFLHLAMFFISGLFVAGGAGQALGFDGIILRNIRRPGKVAKFLFG